MTFKVRKFLGGVDVRPGDCLLYGPRGLAGWIIAIKTWHRIAHVEIYVGDGRSVASRDGIGVDLYPLREDFTQVRRPTQPFDIVAALLWFQTVRGQAYDWWGLVRFVTWGRVSTQEEAPRAQFCSELATRFYARGGFQPFGDEDADAIAPAQFATTALLRLIYAKEPT